MELLVEIKRIGGGVGLDIWILWCFRDIQVERFRGNGEGQGWGYRFGSYGYGGDGLVCEDVQMIGRRGVDIQEGILGDKGGWREEVVEKNGKR